ncbi:hypothetical protein E6L39_33805 [Burkholderia cepacia]|nr:hypothetical protein [Burkholderia cepacia]TEV49022.1 hypothetical protein E3D46_36935 [Burkholderia cepacia]THC60592.1 hypothetical protein E6L39_33805 [Burkholderia cepacia]
MTLPLPFAWTIRMRAAARRHMFPEFRVSVAPRAALTHVNLLRAVGALTRTAQFGSAGKLQVTTSMICRNSHARGIANVTVCREIRIRQHRWQATPFSPWIPSP